MQPSNGQTSETDEKPEETPPSGESNELWNLTNTT